MALPPAQTPLPGEQDVLDACRAFALDEELPGPAPADRWVAPASAGGLRSVVADVMLRSGDQDAATRLARFEGAELHLRTGRDRRWLSDLLDGAGLRWVWVKGPVLAAVAYRRPYVRTYADLDVLLHPEDLEEGLQLLLDGGCSLSDTNWPAVAAGRRGQTSLRLPAGGYLDLHWHLVNEPSTRSRFALSTRALLERRTWTQVGDERFPTLHPTDAALHVALHATLSGGHRLKWLLDVDQALRWADAPPEELLVRGRELGVLLPVAVAVDRADRWLGTLSGPAAALPGSWWRSLVARRCRDLPPFPERRVHHPEVALHSSTRRTDLGSAAATLAHLRHRRRRGPQVDLAVVPEPSQARAARAAWLAEAVATP